MNVLFCCDAFPEARRRLCPLLEQAGHNARVCGHRELSSHLKDADILIPFFAAIDDAVLREGRFGFVQQFGVGLETVDIDAATKAGVWVARVPSSACANAASVAEHVLLLMLSLSRHMRQMPEAFRSGLWGEPAGQALIGKTACILGAGSIGLEVAARLRVCGMRLIAVHNHPLGPLPAGVEFEKVYPLEKLTEAASQADYLLACLNYRPPLKNLVGRDVLRALKPGAFLVNIARGGLLDPDALLEAFESGRLAGAGLDVFWEEPVDIHHPLFKHNLIATPHVAGVTDASYSTMAQVCAENIERYARGETPLWLANNPQTPRRRQPAA